MADQGQSQPQPASSGPLIITVIVPEGEGLGVGEATEIVRRRLEDELPPYTVRGRGGERGSVIEFDERLIMTACGHSFVTCHTDHCFRRQDAT